MQIHQASYPNIRTLTVIKKELYNLVRVADRLMNLERNFVAARQSRYNNPVVLERPILLNRRTCYLNTTVDVENATRNGRADYGLDMSILSNAVNISCCAGNESPIPKDEIAR